MPEGTAPASGAFAFLGCDLSTEWLTGRRIDSGRQSNTLIQFVIRLKR
jgi:hypothetical protein